MTGIHRLQLQLGTTDDFAYFAILWSARPRVAVDGQPLGTFRWRETLTIVASPSVQTITITNPFATASPEQQGRATVDVAAANGQSLRYRPPLLWARSRGRIDAPEPADELDREGITATTVRIERSSHVRAVVIRPASALRQLGTALRRRPSGTIEVRLIGPGLGRQNISTTLTKDLAEAQAFAAIYLPEPN